MDSLKNMAGNAGGLQDQFKDINFPASKDEIVSQLEQKGVPSQITDRIRGDSQSEYKSQDDLMSKVQGMM